MIWATFREQVRRSVLKDPNRITWTDDQLRDICWWALDTFCAHTAVATSVTYDATGTTYALPDNQFESLEEAGLVYTIDSANTRTYLPPFFLASEAPSLISYEEFPKGTLLLSDTPNDATLVVRYFAYYNHPYADDDTIDVPAWGIPALSFLIGAHAMSSVAVNAGNIRQWNSKTDSGNPEHNPLQSLQRHFLQLYENEINRFPRQERQNLWRRHYPG